MLFLARPPKFLTSENGSVLQLKHLSAFLPFFMVNALPCLIKVTSVISARHRYFFNVYHHLNLYDIYLSPGDCNSFSFVSSSLFSTFLTVSVGTVSFLDQKQEYIITLCPCFQPDSVPPFIFVIEVEAPASQWPAPVRLAQSHSFILLLFIL